MAASSVETEYNAQSKFVRERLWIRKFMDDFILGNAPVDIRVNYMGAIGLAKDFKSSSVTKHIATAYHLVRDYIDKGLVSISYVASKDMVADGMTKPLGFQKFETNLVMYRMTDLGQKNVVSPS